MLEPNKFIMTEIGFSVNIFILIINDSILNFTKKGVEYFQIQEHNYDLNFFSFRILQIPVKNVLFYSKDFEFQMYIPE
jgi:hypothetical protein